MPELARGPVVSDSERTAQIQATALTMQHELDLGARALMGLSMSGAFSGLEGLGEGRMLQIESFARGEMLSLSGSGMGRENLERLHELSGTLGRYGITVEVDLDGGSFTLTNNNYIPLALIPAEERLALVEANNFASKCLEQADVLASQGKLDEAEKYLAWAGALQARYSEYVEGARTLEAFVSEREGLASLPAAGVSERSARDALGKIAGRGISARDFPAEFERRMGVSWEEFRESGFASLAMQNMDVAIGQMRAGLAALGARMHEMSAATEGVMMGADLQSCLPPQEYVNAASSARESALFASSIRDDVYTIMGIRKVAEELRGLRFESVLAYSGFLGEERDGIVSMYGQAESSLAKSVFLRSAATEIPEEAERNYRQAAAERAQGAGYLARAEGMIPELNGRYSLAARYADVQQALMGQNFEEVSEANRADLIARRDDLADEISLAAREGREIGDLGTRMRSIGYEYALEYWAEYQFGGVSGRAASAELEGMRGSLISELHSAIDGGREARGVGEREGQLLDYHRRAAAFEGTVEALYQQESDRLDRLSEAENNLRDVILGNVRQIPDEVPYTSYGPGNYRESGYHSFRDEKEELLALVRGSRFESTGQDRAFGLVNLKSTLYGWAHGGGGIASALDLYSPSEIIMDARGNVDVLMTPYFDRLEIVEGERAAIAREYGAAAERAPGMLTALIGNYNNFVETAAQIESLVQSLDLISSAAMLGLAVWKLPSIVQAGRSAMGWIEGVSPALATGVRATLTVGSIAMSAYGGVEFADGVSMYRAAETDEQRMAAAEQMFTGALYIGSLGVAARLPTGLFRAARAVSIGLDATAIATIAPSVAAVSYSMYDKGDVSGWDIAETTLWTGLGIAGAYFGIRVPGGVRGAVREGAEVAAKAVPMSVDQFAEMIRNAPPPQGRFAAEGAGFVRVAELPAPVGPVQREAMEADARTALAVGQAGDAQAAERLVARHRQIAEHLPQRVAVIMPPEVRALDDLMRANPGMGVSQAAAEYVRGQRAAGRELPDWMRGVSAEAQAPPVYPTVREVATPEEAGQAIARGEAVRGPPLSDIEYRSSLASVGRDNRIFIDNHFHNAIPDEAAMDNALIIFGERAGKGEEVVGDFHRVMTGESIGGNAGAGHVAVNAYFDAQGRIIAFGNIQNLPPGVVEGGTRVVFRVNVGTGRIANIFPAGGEAIPESIMALAGMQVTPGMGAEGAGAVAGAARAVEAAAPPAEMVERFSRTFGIEGLHEMWANLQRGIYVIPRPGAETEAMALYESFIRQAARTSTTGEVSGIVFRIDLSGINVGNRALGDTFMDRTIAMRMRGIREMVVETAERLGIEVTPVFTRRPGRSDELMVAVFGPGDTVLAHANEFITALRNAPDERITNIMNTERFSGRTFMDSARDVLREHRSITRFKFDYAGFTVRADMPEGFLNGAVRTALQSGSAAHAERMMEAIGVPGTTLLFTPNPAIRAIGETDAVGGTVFDIALRMPPTVQARVEQNLGEFVQTRLPEMLERGMVREREASALATSIANHGGSLPIDDAARYLFRKATGQALSGEMRTKLLNSLISEEGNNVVANIIDNAVAGYALEHRIVIERASTSPTMQYVFPGMSLEAAATHAEGIQRAMYDALSGEGIGLLPSIRVFDPPAGLTGGDVDMFLTTRRTEMGGGMAVRSSTYLAADYVVTMFGSGRRDVVDQIINLVPEGSRAAMETVRETVETGRGTVTLNDLYEVLMRTDPALFQNFIRMVKSPAVLREVTNMAPVNISNALMRLSGMPF